MSYQVYRKVLESSSVTRCCKGRFVNAATQNVVLAKHDVLEVYSTKGHALVLDYVYPLGAPVEAMEAVRFHDYKNDALVLGFADAKVSVLVWSAQEDRFVTKSLHLLEDPVLWEDRTPADEVHPRMTMRVDPRGPACPVPCVTVLVFARYLFVLPFARPEEKRGADVKDDVDAHLPLEKTQVVDLHEEGIRGVRDVCFVGGYHNPTLMFLFEPDQTWAGRVEFALGEEGKVMERRYLTSSLAILSLSMADAKIITTPMHIASHLPYNAASLTPLTHKPYGALVMGPNTICHVFENEQTGYGIHVNQYGRTELTSESALQMPFGEGELRCASTGAPQTLHVRPNDTTSAAVRLVLDLTGAHLVPLPKLPNHFFLAMASGEVCLLRLQKAGHTGSVSGMAFEAAQGLHPLACMPTPLSPLPSCPIPSCLLTLEHCVFVGSRLGDSMMLRMDVDAGPPYVSFAKAGTFLNTGPVVDIALGDSSVSHAVADEDEPEVFPAPSLGMSMVVPVTLRPSTDLSFAERHATMELVAAVGRDRDGAVCVLNRTVKPLELCAHDINLSGCWSVFFKTRKRDRDEMEGTEGAEAPAEGEAEEQKDDSTKHKYLVLAASEGTTKVLRCGDELQEVVEGDVPVDRTQRTVCAGSVAGGRVVLQVTPDGVRATDVDGNTAVKSIHDATDLDPRVRVHEASIAGEWGVLLLSNGTVQLVTAGHVNPEPAAAAAGARQTLQVDIITPPALSHDDTGDAAHRLGYVTSACLYETTRADTFFFPREDVKDAKSPEGSRVLVCLAWTSGTIQIVNIQDWTLAHEFHSTLETPDVLSPWTPFSQSWREGAEHGMPTEEHIVGLWVGRVEQGDTRPHLMLLTSDEEVHCYKAFLFGDELRFRRTQGINSTTRRAEAGGTATALPRLRPADPSMRLAAHTEESGAGKPVVTSIFPSSPQTPRITSFGDIFGLEGVFVRTPQGGVWGFSEKGFLRLHEMVHMRGGVLAMAPLNATCVKQGFALVTRDRLRIMQLTWHRRMNFRAPWPTRKILLKSSPHKVLYDPRMRTYTLVVSSEVPFRPKKTEFDRDTDPFAGQEGEVVSTEKEVSPSEGVPVPTTPRYELLLYSAYSWKPFTSLALEENEHCLAFANVTLRCPQDAQTVYDGTKGRSGRDVPFQAVGTGFPIAEDIPCRGRILVYRVRVGRTREDRVLEPDCAVVTKGPVTALTSMNGYIFAAVAAKVHVFMYDWTKKTLVMRAWCDTRLYTTSLTVMKDYLLAGDIHNSVQLMRWSEQSQSLRLLGKDVNQVSCAAAETMADRGTLTFVTSDDCGNLASFAFAAPKRILPVADFHTGTTTQKMLPLRTLLTPHASDSDEPRAAPRTALLYGTKEGAIHILQPVAEHIHRDLNWLFSKMITELEHPAGLHPRAVRKYRGRRVRQPDPKSRRAVVIDMSVVTRFLSLPHSVQEQLTAAAGIGTKEQIIATIRSVQQETRYL